jgi:hypothetical protein
LRGAGSVTDPHGLIDALNERAGGLVAARPDGVVGATVLGWGLWADRAQRHLVFGVMTAVHHHAGLLGRKGDALAYADAARERFGRLELYPVVLRRQAPDVAQYRPAMAALRELAVRSPERLTGGHWALMREKEDFAPVPSDLPDENSWLRPALPAGTLLDVKHRLQSLDELAGMPSDVLAGLRRMARHNVDLAFFEANRVPADRRDVATLAKVYGPLAEFDVGVMGKLADAAWYDAAAFRERQGALCEIVPERCFSLGYRLRELGALDEAAVAYQRGFDRATDRVKAANSARWLVRYYLDHGQPAKAEAVARDAADTGSATGLLTHAEFLERRGRLREAEENYRSIQDRYQVGDDIVGFYYRLARVAARAEYEPRLRDALALALPEGLEPLDRTRLDAPPKDGVVVRKVNDNTKRCGIRWGNVIVGLDGFRVRDRRSFRVVNSLTLAPRMQLVVWNGSYQDVSTDLWDRDFRIDLEDLAPRK